MSRHASGLIAWIIQRTTAVYVGLFLVYLLIHFSFSPPADHGTLVAWVNQPLVKIGLLLLIPTLLAHAWVGIRNVLIDYVHNLGARVTLLTLFALVLIASGLVALKAIIAAGLAA